MDEQFPAKYPNDEDRALKALLEQARIQTRLLAELRRATELDPCLLDKIARIACLTANEVHRNTQHLAAIREALEALLDLYRHVHPDAALDAERLAKLKAQIEKCCPPEDAFDPICKFEPCLPDRGVKRGDGWSARSRAAVRPVKVEREPHPAWQIVERPRHLEDERLPLVPHGPFVGQVTPSAPTGNVLNYKSGPGPAPGGMAPVTFRTFTGTELSAGWPPDMSGAKAGDVVLMTGNLWIKLSVDGGKTFTDLDFTKLFAADTTYGGWAGDQVVHYVPSIDCFVLYVQSVKGGAGPNLNKNVVKVALASPADLKKFAGGRDAWRRQWNFTSDTFGLGNSWLDFPDISYGALFVHLNTNVFAARQGKLCFELPLADLKAGNGLSFLFSFDEGRFGGSPTQNIVNDDVYWAEHINNSTMRIYNYAAGTEHYWREREIDNWSMTGDNNIVSAAPDWADWLSEDHRIIGAARIGSVLWFAWTAANGDGGVGGFNFPHAHIRIAQFDIAQDFKLVGQLQVWNADHAFAYPCLIANSDNEMGISLAWGGGGKFFGSHAVGILGDYVVWYGEASTETSLRQQQDDAGNLLTNPDGTPMLFSRWGDYVHVRLAQPDTRFFSAFGYAVLDDPSATPAEKMRYLYVEFGREALAPPNGLGPSSGLPRSLDNSAVNTLCQLYQQLNCGRTVLRGI